MKWECSVCSTEQPCILEIEKPEPDNQGVPEFCPFDEINAMAEWIQGE